MSALSRLAVNEFSQVQVEKGDIVILSARIIPGNEKLITNLVNHFYRREATLFDSRHSNVHVSGHGFREDLKLMINLTRPKYFVPIHGEYRQLKNHALLALDQGIPEDRIHIVENGEILGLADSGAKLLDKIPVGRRFIDEGILEAVHEVVLRDRRYLSADGVLVVVLRMDGMSGELIGEVSIIQRRIEFLEEQADNRNKQAMSEHDPCRREIARLNEELQQERASRANVINKKNAGNECEMGVESGCRADGRSAQTEVAGRRERDRHAS